jgi:hypothetical protein
MSSVLLYETIRLQEYAQPFGVASAFYIFSGVKAWVNRGAPPLECDGQASLLGLSELQAARYK